MNLEQNNQRYLSTLFTAASEYEKHLLGNQFLFIGRDIKTGELSFYEAWFGERQFLHLTGVRPTHGISAARFLSLCKQKRLRVKDITSLPTGQSSQKLEILIPFMNITNTAKMMGDYDKSGNLLYSEKLSGSTRGCMGFVLDGETNYYVANTLLKEDVRNIMARTKQIIAIYRKRIEDDIYPKFPAYVSKDLRGKELIWPQEIAEKIIK